MLTRLRTHGLMPLVTRVAAEQGVTVQALPVNPVAVLALGRALMRRGWSGWSAGNLLGLPAGWDAPTNLPMPAPVGQVAEATSMAARWAAARKGTPAPVDAPGPAAQAVALPALPPPPPAPATPKAPVEAAPLPPAPSPVPAPVAPVAQAAPAPTPKRVTSPPTPPKPAAPAPRTKLSPLPPRTSLGDSLFAPKRGRPRKVKTLPALLPPRPSKEELALDDLEIDAEIDPDTAEELEAVEEAPASPWDPDDPDAAPPGPEEPVVNDQAARLRLMERRRETTERARLREGFYATPTTRDAGEEGEDDLDDDAEEAPSQAEEEELDVAPGGGRGRRTDRITKTELLLGRTLYPVEDHGRPKTRGECANVPRPCPFVSCKYSLYLDVEIDRIIFVFPDREPDEMRPSCALDVADMGPATLEVVGKVTNVTRERIRQVEGRAFRKIKNSKRRLRLLEAIDDE